MTEIEQDYRWRLPDDRPSVPETPSDGILRDWLFLAAIAWAGYQEHGRGTVVADEEGRSCFRPGSICPCHEELVADYDPERQAVVALLQGDEILSIHVVAGWPAPPDAALVTPGERFKLTAH